jgi:hypothetical protein
MIDETDRSKSSNNDGYSSGDLWMTGIISSIASMATIIGAGAIGFNVAMKKGLVQVNNGEEDD